MLLTKTDDSNQQSYKPDKIGMLYLLKLAQLLNKYEKASPLCYVYSQRINGGISELKPSVMKIPNISKVQINISSD
jgi:hypothetical protein